MRIKELKLFTKELEAERAFYTRRLGFECVAEGRSSFTVRVGWTDLTFMESATPHIYHYCFLVPCNQLAAALEWTAARVDVIEIEQGRHTQRFESWNADSFYFFDASGNLAEMIVRHDLKNIGGSPFNVSSILCVNEIGMPTENIRATDAKLGELLGTAFWKGDSERFGTHGDQEGLFLLPDYRVKDKWFPSNQPIIPTPFEILVENREERRRLSYGTEGISTF